jgi:hypothetical protein
MGRACSTLGRKGNDFGANARKKETIMKTETQLGE